VFFYLKDAKSTRTGKNKLNTAMFWSRCLEAFLDDIQCSGISIIKKKHRNSWAPLVPVVDGTTCSCKWQHKTLLLNPCLSRILSTCLWAGILAGHRWASKLCVCFKIQEKLWNHNVDSVCHSMSHTIHVWNYLPTFTIDLNQNVGKYTIVPWSIWMFVGLFSVCISRLMFMGTNLRLFFAAVILLLLKKNTSDICKKNLVV